MKKLLLIILATTLGSNLFAQNFNKEKDHLTALSKEKENHVYVDFLNKLDFSQEIGIGEPAVNYIAYKETKKLDKHGNIILKKHPYFSSFRYNVSNGIVGSITLNINPQKVEYVNELLTSLYGAADQISYGHLGQSIFFVPNKYYMRFKTHDNYNSSANSFLTIYSLDFMENYTKYDEFSKVGMVYYNFTPIKRVNDATYNSLYFIYTFNKKENYKGYAIKNEFVGSDWLFIDKIDFLIDDDEVITFNVEPNRKVNKLFTVSCTENSINTISSEFIDKILNAKTVKVKICGKSNFIKFDLTPLHKYQIATAKYYYDNDIIPAN